MLSTQRSAVVTGASTGIGEATALHLDRLGFTVHAGVRKTEDGDRLRHDAKGDVKPVLLDVTDEAEISAAAKLIEGETGGVLDALVNNAGIVVAGPLELLPLDEIRRQLEVNVIGQIAVTQAFLPMIRAARGRIVNIGSIGGRFAGPYSAPYAASKFAMEAITDSLRVELLPWGIHVSIVEPGNIKTPIWQKGIRDGESLTRQLAERLGDSLERLYGDEVEAMFDYARKSGESGIPPSRVALAVEHALTSQKPKTRYLVGTDARIQALIARFVPDRWKDKLVLQQLGTPRHK